MTNHEEENIQENFSMSYTENSTGGKFLYILILIIICFTAGVLIYFFGYLFYSFYLNEMLFVKEGLKLMASDGPSGRTDFLSTRLTTG